MTAIDTLDFDRQIQSPDFTADPYPVYQAMRRDAPVYFSDLWQAWLVTRYPEVVTVLKENRQFSNAGRQAHLLDLLPPGDRQRLAPLRDHYAAGGLINTDRPAHTRLRNLVAKAFSPRIMRAIEPLVADVAGSLIGSIEEDRETDLIHVLAYPLPAIVIAGLLGVPVEMRDQFKLWSVQANAFAGSGRPTLQGALAAQESILALKAYLSRLARRAAANTPRGPSLPIGPCSRRRGSTRSRRNRGYLLHPPIGRPRNDDKSYRNAVCALLRNPDRLRELRGNPNLMTVAVEEFLRYDSSVQRVKRVALEDVAIDDKKIPAGSLVYAFIGSANRDETAFSHPNRLDFRRTPQRHIAFGGGIHFCLGAALARIEARICLDALIVRFPTWDWNGGLDLAWIPDSALRGLQRLPLRFPTNG